MQSARSECGSIERDLPEMTVETLSGNQSIYRCENLSHHYALGTQAVPALTGINIKFDRGDIVCLTGPSGSGKSTLLNILGLIEPVQKGDLFLDGQNLAQLPNKQKNNIRRFKLGFIFQNFHLIEVLRADENIDFFLARQSINKRHRCEMVEAALRSVGLWEHRHKYPPQMSGGQRQRVAIARALAKKPDVIIADEPTASLDQKTGRSIMQILSDLSRKNGVTVIMASHDPMVLEFATTVIELYDGRITEDRQSVGGQSNAV